MAHINLAQIFSGFVRGYRSLKLRFSPRYESMTQWTRAEIGWFRDLGECLGFYGVEEKDVFKRGRPCDLVWVDPLTDNVVLHLERENRPDKIRETIHEKLLPAGGGHAAWCIAVFDELSPEHHELLEREVTAAMKGARTCSEFLCICYSRIPSPSEAAHKQRRRYEMEWTVRALHVVAESAKWLEARCTTDREHFYTMHHVEPAIRTPYRQ